MAVCAYCKQERQATREHVIPAFLYDFQRSLEQNVIGWNEVAVRMVGGEGKVKDVCSECNNSILSQLDAYGKELLVGAGLLVRNYTKQSLTLRYDYTLLLRWLLKVSFNSSRVDRAHSPLFEPFVPFILGNAAIPSRNEIACLAYLAGPERLGASRIKPEPFMRISNGSKVLNPFFVRIAYGGVTGETRFTLRLIVFNPAVFALLLFHPHTPPGHAASAVRAVQKQFPGAIELNPQRRVVELNAGPKSYLDLFEQQIRRAQAHAGGWENLETILARHIKGKR